MSAFGVMTVVNKRQKTPYNGRSQFLIWGVDGHQVSVRIDASLPRLSLFL